MKYLNLLIGLLITLTVQAQYFVPQMASDEISLSKEVYVVTTNGDTIRGKSGGATLMNGQMTRFNIKLDDGTKQKFKAEELLLVAIKPSKFTNITGALEATSLQNDLKAFDDVIDREWVYYEQALLPKKKDKYALMQLANPGFDSRIKVYYDPTAKETKGVPGTGGMVGGGKDKSYLVVYDGNKSELYKKGNYKKDALKLLYKNCDIFMDNYQGEKFKWKNFAEHVFVFDQLCNDPVQ